MSHPECSGQGGWGSRPRGDARPGAGDAGGSQDAPGPALGLPWLPAHPASCLRWETSSRKAGTLGVPLHLLDNGGRVSKRGRKPRQKPVTLRRLGFALCGSRSNCRPGAGRGLQEAFELSLGAPRCRLLCREEGGPGMLQGLMTFHSAGTWTCRWADAKQVMSVRFQALRCHPQSEDRWVTNTPRRYGSESPATAWDSRAVIPRLVSGLSCSSAFRWETQWTRVPGSLDATTQAWGRPRGEAGVGRDAEGPRGAAVTRHMFTCAHERSCLELSACGRRPSRVSPSCPRPPSGQPPPSLSLHHCP